MRIDSKAIPPHIQRLMPDQQRLDLGVKLPEEIQAKLDQESESHLHDQMMNLMNLRGIYFTHSRMDRKTTNALGTPDFILCYNGKFAAVEVKFGNNQISMKQEDHLNRIRAAGGKVVVVRSLEQFRDFLNELEGNQ